MSNPQTGPSWLPYTQGPAHGPAGIVRIAAYVVIVGAIVTSIIQFQYVTHRNHMAAVKYEARHKTQAAASLPADDAPPKPHAGAIGRWVKVVQPFWSGQNIYAGYDTAEPNALVVLHPNMPFIVILMTPFAHLSPDALAAVWNTLKFLALIVTVLLAVRLVNHNGQRMPDWVVGLAALWSLAFVMGDIRHGNTNIFVLTAIALHLWLYRRGKDWLSGGALALAICLKMTPALFILYWLYQRSWKILAATVLFLTTFAVVVPATAMGPHRYAEFTGTWLKNLIQPGLVKGDWYPIHINQSLSGVAGRYLLGGPGGNLEWNPDDLPYSAMTKFQWINVVSLDPAAAKIVVRIGQTLIVLLMAWAIGWRRLPRDDGRRSLHYALVLAAILLLNQRTWDHHAAILLIADLAVWYAIAFARVSRRARLASLAMMAAALLAFAAVPAATLAARLAGHAKQADAWANALDAYGPMFLHFLLVFLSAVVLSVSARKAGEPPYAEQRQAVSR